MVGGDTYGGKDKAAICLSFLCAVHCMLAPIAVLGAGFGFLSWLADAEWLHYVLFAPMLLLMLLSLPAGFKSHGNVWPILFAVIGIGLFTLGLFNHESLGTLLSVFGSVLLIFAHWKNLRLNQSVMPII
jgi:hypothetical protein